MKEKPILFSTLMVQALLNTKPGVWPAEPIDPDKPFKWMTRRVVTRINGAVPITEFGKSDTPGYDWHFKDKHLRWHDVNYIIPPYQKGDILWVRETWAKVDNTIIYLADYPGTYPCKMKPSIFMPREASRLSLEIKAIRNERVQEINEEDARAEGVEGINPLDLKQLPTSLVEPGGAYSKGFILKKSYRAGFYQLWDHLNAKRGYSWDSNPYVWVYEVMRREQ
jgi:hypothetical protein